MIEELKKAFKATDHPGISSGLTLPRIARQASPYFFSPSGRSAPPLTLYWSINSVCNLACKMCDVGMANKKTNFYKNLRLDGKKTEMPIEVFKRIVNEVSVHKPMQSITSTEPLVYRPLAEAIEHVVSKDMEIMITTGGYNLPRRASELAEAGLSQLAVSIDGPPELHNSIRGRKDSFERSVEGIRAFHSRAQELGKSPRIMISCTITSFNFDRLVDFYESVADLPVMRINFSIYNFVTQEMADAHNVDWGEKYHATVNCIGGDNDPDQVDPQVLHSQVEAVKKLDATRRKAVFLYDYDQEGYQQFFHRPDQFMTKRRCMVNWFVAEIIADGTMIPYTRCYHVPLGNIMNESFYEVWNGEKARAWRRDLRKQKRFPACKRCAFAL